MIFPWFGWWGDGIKAMTGAQARTLHDGQTMKDKDLLDFHLIPVCERERERDGMGSWLELIQGRKATILTASRLQPNP